MKKIISILLFLLFCMELVGCGETVRGIGKDINRVGRGVKTIFVSEGN